MTAIGVLVRAAHATQRAAIRDDDLTAHVDDWTEDRADCTADPRHHTRRYQLESEWRQRREAWTQQEDTDS